VAVLGLAGFVLLDAVEREGELHMTVETTASRAGCPECGVLARSKGRKTVQVRDMPAGGRPVRLWWRKRRWCCADPDCENKTWSEQVEAIRPRAVLSERAARDGCVRVGRDGISVAEMAREYLVAWSTAMAAVERLGRRLVDDADRIGVVAELGVDETAFVRSGPGRRPGFLTGMVDLERHRLLDVVRGRSGNDLRVWLEARPADWCGQVRTVAIDPHEGYRQGLKPHLEHVTLVVDPFHVTALANRVVHGEELVREAVEVVDGPRPGHGGHRRGVGVPVRRYGQDPVRAADVVAQRPPGVGVAVVIEGVHGVAVTQERGRRAGGLSHRKSTGVGSGALNLPCVTLFLQGPASRGSRAQLTLADGNVASGWANTLTMPCRVFCPSIATGFWGSSMYAASRIRPRRRSQPPTLDSVPVCH
jgi:Transposase/zinc-finger of transposase IS204/IS1001/IS1096/IS1165